MEPASYPSICTVFPRKNKAAACAQDHLLRPEFLLFWILVTFAWLDRADAQTIPFRLLNGTLIVVDVWVDHSGPYAFLLDTGTTSSAIDVRLSKELGMQESTSVHVTTVAGESTSRRVEADSLSLGPVSVRHVLVKVQQLPVLESFQAHLRGVLGQDVLRTMDFLIDYRRSTIELDIDARLARDLSGERLSLEEVRRDDGARTLDVWVPGTIEGRTRPARLLLDSGSDSLVLSSKFLGINPVDLRSRWRMLDDHGRSEPTADIHFRLRVGAVSLSVAGKAANLHQDRFSVDGLLPTSCFRRLYISNSAHFVILEPELLLTTETGKDHDSVSE